MSQYDSSDDDVRESEFRKCEVHPPDFNLSEYRPAPSEIQQSTFERLSYRNSTSSFEDFNRSKKQRPGSISGRLQAANELEEKGMIDKFQKGVLKVRISVTLSSIIYDTG
jgi:hypothetical protein